MKLTRSELRDFHMPANQHNATTYGEWCRKEVERIGPSAVYVEETKPAGIFCRVERKEEKK